MKNLLRYIPSILIMLFIFFSSSATGTQVEDAGLGWEPIHIFVHFSVYLFLSISFYFAIANYRTAFLYTFVYSIFDEIHQYFVPGRSASLFDIFTDSIGAVLGLVLIWFYYLVQKKTHKK